jgi:aspartyl/glutamyl-tRNA(Asn/Gln) amidotransferase C subunit
MSTSDAQHSADLNAQTVSAIANLARLSLDDTQSAEYAQSLNKILGMMETLKGIDTDGVEPLKSPFDIHNLYVKMWFQKPIIVMNIKLCTCNKMVCTLYLA